MHAHRIAQIRVTEPTENKIILRRLRENTKDWLTSKNKKKVKFHFDFQSLTKTQKQQID